ncbi:hypothetical protein JAAARDRAFT_31810 [Jaapia argillacea MUCL 33604]|uniref:XPA C-terminal domain-containing protein n=1 Tax=Jaapia argillacea MUCL 33604 TaxID=933084 RepID=A0A067QE07_9AGAM|nr:hypothetical protein JAAARDRAFT_31810 [Jaapia argillacea MUCL 33604]
MMQKRILPATLSAGSTAGPSSLPSPTASRKRPRPLAIDPSSMALAEESPEARTKNSPAKRQKTERNTAIREWSDIPKWDTNKSVLLDMPVEILDKIFGTESGLRLQDHLALSGVCRSIRKAYTEKAWQVLMSHYTLSYTQRTLANHIFSDACIADSSPGSEHVPVSLESPPPPQPETPTKSRQSKKAKKADLTYRDRVVEIVNEKTLTTTNAKSQYKLTEKELLTLPFTTRVNPHNRYGARMRLFKDARVYALAMRVHGGPVGHEAHLQKLAGRVAKAKATREKNGTVPVKTAKPRMDAVAMLLPIMILHDWGYDDEDDEMY